MRELNRCPFCRVASASLSFPLAFPSIGCGANRPLTTLCPSYSSLPDLSLSTSLSFPLVSCAPVLPLCVESTQRKATAFAVGQVCPSGGGGGHSKAGEATRTAGTGNQNGGDGRACAWEAATTKGMTWPASPVATRRPGARATPAQPASGAGCLPQPRWAVCATGAGAHQGQTSREGEKDIWWTAGTRRGGRGTWASRTQNHSEAGYGRPVDRGTRTTKTVKRPQQQPAHPQYATYWVPLTRKWHTMPHSAQPQHTKYWAPRTRKRHQQEHRPQRPTESSNPTQHAKGRMGDCPGPRKGTTTRRNVTRGGGFQSSHSNLSLLSDSLVERGEVSEE